MLSPEDQEFIESERRAVQIKLDQISEVIEGGFMHLRGGFERFDPVDLSGVENELSEVSARLERIASALERGATVEKQPDFQIEQQVTCWVCFEVIEEGSLRFPCPEHGMTCCACGPCPECDENAAMGGVAE